MKVQFLLLGLFCLADSGSVESGGVRAIDDFSSSLRQFAAYMYDEVSKNTMAADNIFFSPLSIAETLGMVMAGAQGQTHRQITNALRVNPRQHYSQINFNKLFKKIYNKLFNQTKGNSATEALLANKLFLQQQYVVNSTFKKDLKEYFDADLTWVDFSHKVVSAHIINSWVSQKTGGMIKDLIDADNIDPMTRMILVNALYFKAAWNTTMYKKGFGDRNFETPNGIIRVPFIGRRGEKLRYDTLQDSTIVSIPYKNGDADLVIIMPDNPEAMTRFSRWNTLNGILRDLPTTLSNLRKFRTTFSMPMFEVEQTLDLKEILQRMHVKDLFDPMKADLSGITEEKAYVSMFTHKAKVTVDEQGTTAAAATGAHIAGRSAFPPTVTIDKPFFFAIHRQGHLLFFGKISTPQTPPQAE